MGFIFFIVLAIGAAWYYAGLRGKLTVRAFVYVSEVAAGRTEWEANKTALSLDYNAASKCSGIAMNYVNTIHGGRQLDLISEARLLGFRG